MAARCLELGGGLAAGRVKGFLVDGNVLCLDCGVGHRGEYIYETPY